MSMLNNILKMIPVIVPKKKDKKPSLIKDLINEPDKFMLQAYVEDEEIIIKLKKRV